MNLLKIDAVFPLSLADYYLEVHDLSTIHKPLRSLAINTRIDLLSPHHTSLTALPGIRTIRLRQLLQIIC
jgi:hypothetical protein